MPHTCEAAVVHCMDFRIQETVNNLLKSLNLKEGDFDRISVAGGAANFEQLKRHIELSKSLHHSRLFILTIHEDCGAGAKMENLLEAKELIMKTHPDCEIKSFYIKLNGAWKNKN